MGVINFEEWKCTEYYMESNKDLVNQSFPIVDGFLSNPVFIYKDKSYTAKARKIDTTSISYFINQLVLNKRDKLFFLLSIGGGYYIGDNYYPIIRYAVI
jgi:hypothetical protein